MANLIYNTIQIVPVLEFTFNKKIIVGMEVPLNMLLFSKGDASYDYYYKATRIPYTDAIYKQTSTNFNEIRTVKYLIDNKYFVNYFNLKFGLKI